MLKKITGSCYKNMINHGINNLDRHRSIVNDLNVFPVPDGDTGTNMVMTMKTGLHSIKESTDKLSSVAKRFANAAVFGARGNSGVIMSQFFRGISEGFNDEHSADPAILSRALKKGCEYAYASVAKPVEGTILTVIKDATEAIDECVEELRTVDEVIAVFLKEAKKSLANTPKLLPILAKAGVVDSGGSGIVYFFEGIQKYLNGEEIEASDASSQPQYVDYSAFGKNTKFEFGYCTEVLLQLTEGGEAFDRAAFVPELEELGDSVVVSLEGDKVKLHVHTRLPERVLAFCHRFGEFLSMKVENMTVQHTQSTKKLLLSDNPNQNGVAIVAVAPSGTLQSMLCEMGADVVIMSPEVPSSKDFIEAFEAVSAKDILVFPNSSNSILSAMQAGSLYKESKITVLNCRSIAECYSALAIIDFNDADINSTVNAVNETIRNIYQVSVVHATKNIKYGNKTIVKNDYFALSGDEILTTGDRFENVVKLTVKDVLDEREASVINMFYGKNRAKEQIEKLAADLEEVNTGVEFCLVPTEDPIYDLVLSFE